MKRGFDRYELDARILGNLPGLGYKRPTAVHERVIPLLIQGKDLLVEAPTGSGKTAAYGLPCLSRIDINKRAVQALILVPSRELARQVESALRDFAADTPLRIEAVYGGAPLKEGQEKLAKNPHVLVAVPGRLRDILRDEKFPYFWRNINFLVIDEADRLLEQGFQEEVLGFLPHVKKGAQVSLYSATLNEDIEAFAKEKFGTLIEVKLRAEVAWRNISFFRVDVHEGRSEAVLVSLIRQRKVKNALIFCNKRDEVYGLSRFLRANGVPCEAYHGLMDQVERDAVMNRFRLKQVRFLIATDLAARGLDIQDLSAVIHFSFPDDYDIYLHRVGRTGRAGKTGDCYCLMGSDMDRIHLNAFHKQANIPVKTLTIETEEGLKTQAAPESRIQRLSFSRGKADKIRKTDILGFLVKEEGISPDDIGTISIYDNHALVDLPRKHAGRLAADPEPKKLKGKSLKIKLYGLEEEKARAGKVRKLVVSSKTREAKKKRAEGKAVAAPVSPKTGTAKKKRAEGKKK